MGYLNPIDNTEAGADAVLASFVPAPELVVALYENVATTISDPTFTPDECTLSRSGKVLRCKTTGASLSFTKVRSVVKTRFLTANHTKPHNSTKTFEWNIKVRNLLRSLLPTHLCTRPPTHLPPLPAFHPPTYLHTDQGPLRQRRVRRGRGRDRVWYSILSKRWRGPYQ